MAHVYIGIPQHGGQLSTSTMHSIQEAVMNSRHGVSYQAMGLSLLARNFNSLWIQAYKRGADYFCLHHSDLGVSSPYPGVCWLDLMIERMNQLGAAVLSVASPIKSPAGHYSLGLDLERGNRYSLRRITQRELNLLPEMFICRHDVCDVFGVTPKESGALIVNTGCWLMDLKRFPWSQLRWPGFNIVDTIEWSINGVPAAYTEPEDWFQSRWLFRHKLPYYTTREIRLDHQGGYTYHNYGLWGDMHDLTPTQPDIDIWHSLTVPMEAAA